MTIDKSLLAHFMSATPFQPATNFWRAIEVSCVIASSLPSGLGLDLGCGDGKLMKIILDAIGPRELVGVDLDPKETKQAIQLGIYKKVHVTRAHEIPEPDGGFDFVFSNSVLEHIGNIEEVLAESARLLKTGGHFIFTVPGTQFHACLKGPMFPWTTRQNYLKNLDSRVAHLRYWCVEDWKDHLQPNRLRIIEVQEYLNQAEVRRWETLARFTSGILYPFYRGKKQPIEIMRSLGLRKSEMRPPGSFSKLISYVLAYGINTERNRHQHELKSCLMIRAVKE